MTTPDIVEKDARLSECGRYRYLLRRVWDHYRPRALLVMLNPSTADAEIDDPTIRSCVRLLNALGFGSFEVVNLFAWRATDPAELKRADAPIGPDNDKIIEGAVRRCDVVICAWGAHPEAARRSRSVVDIVRRLRPAVFCLGKTMKGHPKHPLYIKTGTGLETFP